MQRIGLILGLLISLTSCSMHPVDRGQQYADGYLRSDLNKTKTVNTTNKLANYRFKEQVEKVIATAPTLTGRYKDLYTSLIKWSEDGGKIQDLAKYNIQIAQMGGDDNYGNVLFTGYFSPLLNVNKTQYGPFKHPLYAKPDCETCPTRAQIYSGALDKQDLELAYSDSMFANFLMEIQGSGFVRYLDNEKLSYFAYGGKNNRAYIPIGKVLIERGEIPRSKMTMRAIKNWIKTNPKKAQELMEQNPSFVFFKEVDSKNVIGSAGVPLVAGASVAGDTKLLPMGSAILAEVPQLDSHGKLTGKYQLKLMLVLDTGGAVKKGHLDLYYGIGERAGEMAGFNKYFGRVWKLGLPNSYSSQPWQ